MSSFVIKGDLCYSRSPKETTAVKDGYLVCEDGLSKGVFGELPQAYAALPLLDYTGRLVIPGLVDLHMHAPQYAYRGLGMDLELLDWLNAYTFPEEARYQDLDYAKTQYQRMVADLRKGPNTRCCLFATVHGPATESLMDLMEESGLISFVGKVNMDRNAPESLVEGSAEASLEATRAWLDNVRGKYGHTKPILTPRFIPSCTDGLMEGLHQLQRETGLALQSHLSENPKECAWVQELCPDSQNYTDAYARFQMIAPGVPAVMAHCVWNSPQEMAVMKAAGVFVAHCPQSNTNIASGIAPARRYMDLGIPMGLGSDVAGGAHASIFRAMTDAIQVSKLRWRLVDDSLAPLTEAEAFFLGTLGGGAFFGKVGSFLEGYEADALVLDDSDLLTPCVTTLEQRLARVMYLSDDRHIQHKFVAGQQLF